MQPQMYRNHYKTDPERKNRILLFVVGGFYRAYESDAVLLGYLFGFQVQVQWWTRMTGFPANAGEKYMDLLKQADYSYVLLQIHETGPVVLQYHLGTKPLEITIPIDVYASLLDEMKSVIQKYEASMRLLKHVDLPFLDAKGTSSPLDLPPFHPTGEQPQKNRNGDIDDMQFPIL